MLRSLFACSLFLTIVAPFTAAAGDWTQWRGPLQTGVVPGSGYPVEWGEDKNIVWKVKLPGWGTSTPAILGERIFVTSEEEGNNALFCLDLAGQQVWKGTFGKNAGNKNRKASGANPSPITDGTHVYVYYRSGDLACVDLAGKTVWHVNLQEKYGQDRLNWDLGTSPVLTKDLVVVAVMHQGPSYLVALNKTTGEVVWKQDRDLGAPRESRDSYTTPIVLQEDGRETLVVLGADHVTVHDAADGKEIARVGGLNPGHEGNFRQIASPVVSDGIVVAPYARGRTLTAIRLGGTGDVTKSHVAWSKSGPYPDVPTPAALDGRVYLCGDRGEITCLDMKTGHQFWTERLPRGDAVFSASPVIADGKMYATNENGTTFVLQLGDKPELIATNQLRENTYATPAFVDGRVYVRTAEYLFCIADK
jgi:outer membrane protein assembly factor BamB